MARIYSLINVASEEVGITEYPPNSNNVRYNTWYYGKEVNGSAYPWCAAFVSWCGWKVDANLIGKFASCKLMAENFKRRKQWYTSGPRVGDIVFFKFGTAGNWTNHVGIVAEVQTKGILTIEGNTGSGNDTNGGAVMKRYRKSNIVGYGRPDYDDKIDTFPELSIGSINPYVKILQSALTNNGYICTTDGEFGPKTKTALVCYQKEKGLNPDGVCGPKTWNKIK